MNLGKLLEPPRPDAVPAVPAAPAPGSTIAPELGEAPSWVEHHAGDVSSALAIAGTVASFATPLARIAPIALGGSVVAGAVDTAIQGLNTYFHHRNGSNIKTTLYAATGVIPASNLASIKGMKSVHQIVRHASEAMWLATNTAFLGAETMWKVPKIADRSANTSEWLAYGAAITGVLKHR